MIDSFPKGRTLAIVAQALEPFSLEASLKAHIAGVIAEALDSAHPRHDLRSSLSRTRAALPERGAGLSSDNETVQKTLSHYLPGARTQTSPPLRGDAQDAHTLTTLPRPGTSGPGAQRPSPPTTAPAPPFEAPRAAPTAPPPLPEEEDFLPRYVPTKLLGVGGMSEVWRARDNLLDRDVALKILSTNRQRDPESIGRFAREATTTAALQHPGITPLYDIGTVADGRPFIAMKEIRGRTLTSVIEEAHSGGGEGHWSTWRLVESFRRVCAAMAYAHEQGVVHRDLKPDNIMVGAFGEVLVVDWGIAKASGEHTATNNPARRGSHLAEALGAGLNISPVETGDDVLVGTPSYMPPELVQEEVNVPSTRADVYALGAILYEILAGEPPHTGATAIQIFVSVVRNRPEPLPESVPGELREICARAMSKAPADRYPSALELGEEVQGWLEQAKLREQALEILKRSEVFDPEQDHRAPRERAATLREQARSMLRGVRPWAPVAEKRPAWTLEDEAMRLELMAEVADVQYIQALRSALSLVPDLPEAQDKLASHYHKRHSSSEARGDLASAARNEILLRSHDQGRYAAYLKGTGALTLVTAGHDAEATLYRFETHERRLVPVFERRLGRTPLRAVPLQQGSYRVRLEARGREPVDYPVWIGRGEHWEGKPPGAEASASVYLPVKGSLGQEDVYVPGSYFWCGGDETAPGSLPKARVWQPSFVVRRFPITNREFLIFLNDLVAQGRGEEASRWVPRGASPHPNELGEPAYGRQASGAFYLTVDGDGDRWEEDWPVMLIDWYAARAYAAWEAERSGLPWRLLRDLEWEKAARGVDARLFPWGDYVDPTWCCMRESARRPMLVPVTAYPEDVSPYGVRGLAGNVRDWCEDPYERGPADARGDAGGGADLERDVAELSPRVNRGGFFNATAAGVRAAARDSVLPDARGVITGFRIARSLSEAEEG